MNANQRALIATSALVTAINLIVDVSQDQAPLLIMLITLIYGFMSAAGETSWNK